MSSRFIVFVIVVLIFLFGVLFYIGTEAPQEANGGLVQGSITNTYEPPLEASGTVLRQQSTGSPKPVIKNTSEECSISSNQLSNIQFSFNYGLEYDLGYTLAAIAIKESNAGLWKVNVQDPSGGLYHVTADKVLKLRGWDDNNFNRNRAIQLLIENDEVAALLAVETLLYWKEYNAGNWLDTWASYNHGYNGTQSERGRLYAEDIRSLISRIQSCGWVNEQQQS